MSKNLTQYIHLGYAIDRAYPKRHVFIEVKKITTRTVTLEHTNGHDPAIVWMEAVTPVQFINRYFQYPQPD